MNKYYNTFLSYLENEEKENAVLFSLELLEKDEIDITTLYEEILAPALNNMLCTEEAEDLCIWKEHVRTSIVRTIIECCYPHIVKVVKEKYWDKSKKKVIVVCPTEEYHEIGAKMASDFFTLLGYESTFIGSNTPRSAFLSSIDIIKPHYIAISVTDYYNLVAAKKVISEIRSSKFKNYKILVGGNAFQNNYEKAKSIGADRLVYSFKDIEKLSEEENI